MTVELSVCKLLITYKLNFILTSRIVVFQMFTDLCNSATVLERDRNLIYVPLKKLCLFHFNLWSNNFPSLSKAYILTLPTDAF